MLLYPFLELGTRSILRLVVRPNGTAESTTILQPGCLWIGCVRSILGKRLAYHLRAELKNPSICGRPPDATARAPGSNMGHRNGDCCTTPTRNGEPLLRRPVPADLTTGQNAVSTGIARACLALPIPAASTVPKMAISGFSCSPVWIEPARQVSYTYLRIRTVSLYLGQNACTMEFFANASNSSCILAPFCARPFACRTPSRH